MQTPGGRKHDLAEGRWAGSAATGMTEIKARGWGKAAVPAKHASEEGG